jgi:hypothetical protein
MTKEQNGAKIIRNLGLLDDAAKALIHTIEEEIFSSVGKLVSSWVQTKEWCGEFDYYKMGIWVAPKAWLRAPSRAKHKPKQEADALFLLSIRQGDDDGASNKSDYFDLTRLCQLRQNQLGWLWDLDRKALGLTGHENRVKWRHLFQEHASQFASQGFVTEKRGMIFLPVKVENEHLAVAYEQQKIENALVPVIDALTKIHGLTNDFSKLVTLAKTTFSK